jgi:hypothetical protein
MFLATGIRVSELAALRYCRDGHGRGDMDLQAREITVRGCLIRMWLLGDSGCWRAESVIRPGGWTEQRPHASSYRFTGGIVCCRIAR